MADMSPEQLAAMQKENLGPGSVALIVTFTVLAVVCVGLRLFSRLRLVKNIGLEDYFIALSMVCMRGPEGLEKMLG